MEKKKSNNEADVKNKNIGTKGTNVTTAIAEGNRSKQLEQTKKATPKVPEAKKPAPKVAVPKKASKK